MGTQDKYCRSTGKQESSRTNALTGCVGIFIMTSWAPRGALRSRHQIGKGLLSQPRQGFEHGVSSSHARTFTPALSAVDERYVLMQLDFLSMAYKHCSSAWPIFLFLGPKLVLWTSFCWYSLIGRPVQIHTKLF